MKIFRHMIIALFSLLLIAGCSKREELPKPSIDIVGHWKMSDIDVKGAHANDDSEAKARESRLEVIFRADQSCKITIWQKSGEVTDNIEVTDDIEGRYLLECDSLTISGPTIANYKFNLSTSSGSLMLNFDDGDTKVKLTLTRLGEESKIQDEQDAGAPTGISFSVSIQNHFNLAGGRTFNFR
jgi:hypothetical protein